VCTVIPTVATRPFFASPVDWVYFAGFRFQRPIIQLSNSEALQPPLGAELTKINIHEVSVKERTI